MPLSPITGAPLARDQAAPLRRRLGVGFALLWAAVAVHSALILSGAAQSSASLVRITDLAFVLVGFAATALVGLRGRHVGLERAAWAWLTGAMFLYALGGLVWDLVYLERDTPPYPSLSDAFWAAFYVPTYIGLALLIRARLPQLPRAVALDGLVSALGLAALVAALALGPILAETGGSPGAVLVNLAYPIGDLMLLALCAATLALTGGRPGRAWAVLVAGLAAFAVADTGYLLAASTGTYAEGGPLDVLWALGLASVALAAWQVPRAVVDHAPGRRDHAVPAVLSIAAVALLAYGALVPGMPLGAVGLAIATLLATGLRVGLVVRDVQRLSESGRLAESDELTGLLNRRGLSLRLEDALQEVRSGTAVASLLLLDLDRFKEINDTLGHHAGDQLLEEVARRLQAGLPEATLARLGGDEFVALLACGREEALIAARTMGRALERPIELDGLTTHTQASIGIACSPEHGGRRGDLLRHADVAMYRAKARGVGVELYAAEGDRNTRERLALAGELRAALADPGQILLHYQPQLDLDTGQVRGVEALVRWQHPEHGLLGPESFLDIAEQHALMHDLTLAVIDRALRQQRAWRRAGTALKVAVNVSAADLLDTDFPTEIAERLAAHGTSIGALQLELTESTVMREPGRALDTLARLSELGLTLSLDDFGTGYSSLAHLKRLPVQELKIDRSFVLDMLADRDDAIIVRSTVELGRSLGLRVVAEGVETVEHLDRLRYFGCHLAQGYLIARPMPAVKVVPWLREHRPAAMGTEQRPDPAARPGATGPALGSLLEVAGRVVDGAPPSDVFAHLGRELRALVPHDDLVVYGLEAGGASLAAVHADGRWVPETRRDRFPAGEGITGAALREGRMRNVARTDLDPDSVQVPGTAEEPEALVCCPMAADGRPVGVLNVYRSGSWVPFTDDEAATVERFAAVASLALRPAAVAGAGS